MPVSFRGWVSEFRENFGDDCVLYQCDFTVPQYPAIDDGSGTWASYNAIESRNGCAGYYLTDGSSGVYLKENIIVNGIRDDGSADLRLSDDSL